jgi:hypothetical protein
MKSHKLSNGLRICLAASLAFLIALSVYVATMSRSLGWHDSAELALAGWRLGASHAPGSPLHSLLGYMATHAATLPFAGTTFLSVLTAASAAGLLAWLLMMLTNSLFASICAALIFAFSYQVWTVAVITEVYSLGMALLAVTMLFAWLWRERKSPALLVWLSLSYVIALSAYFANVLLLPVVAGFIWLHSPSRIRDLLGFGLIALVGIVLIALANIALAANAPPSGDVLPESLWSVFLYMSGAQHDPLQAKGFSFAAGRLWQHSKLMSSSLLYLTVPIGLFGFARLYRSHGSYALFLGAIFAVYFLYYTVFGPGDYYMMVLPSYFVFTLCAGIGVAEIFRLLRSPSQLIALRIMVALFAVSFLVVQLSARISDSHELQAETFAANTFAVLPSDALAIVGWKEYTSLRYLQEVDSKRRDLRIMLPARTVRRYPYATVADYLPAVVQELCVRPVYSVKSLQDLVDAYPVHVEEIAGPWRKLTFEREFSVRHCERDSEKRTDND